MTDFAEHLRALKAEGGAVADYAVAREEGYLPLQRTFEFCEGKLTSMIMLVSPDGGQRTYASQLTNFHQLAFDHRFIYNKRLDHRLEFACHQREPVPAVRGELSVTVSCGLFRVTQHEIQELWISEEAAPKHSARRYRLLLPIQAAKLLCPVPAEPKLTISIRSGGAALFTLHAYVDQVLPVGTEGDDETMLAIVGDDAFAATRLLLTAGYNLTSIPGESILKLGIFLDVPNLKPDAVMSPILGDFAKSMNGATADDLTVRLQRELAAVSAKTQGNVRDHAEMFADVARHSDFDALHIMGSFLHSAWALDLEIPVAFAVGHIKGVRTEGAVRLAPNVVVCTQDSHPVRRAVEEHDKGPLCATWPSDGALLIAFYIDPGDPKQLTDNGWEALRNAFTLLSNAVCDAGWLRTSDAGDPIVFLVDGRVQDAALELSPHYHVQCLFSKIGHQSYAGVQKSSHELDLNDLAVAALRPRIDLLTIFLRQLETKNLHLCNQLRRAMEWLAKSRNATTVSEQFVCLWVALEYLLVKKGTANIKDAVSRGISAVMSKGERVARNWWRAQAEDAYETRCAIVHDAEEDTEKIERLTPLVRQAAFEVIWACASSLKSDTFTHPSQVVEHLIPLRWTTPEDSQGA